MRTPEDAVVAAFAAINTEDWHALTMLCDPVSLPIFKKQTVDLLSDYDDACAMESDFGEDHLDLAEMLRYEVAGASSIEEVREMDPGRVFA